MTNILSAVRAMRLLYILAFCLSLSVCTAAFADEWPSRPVKVVAPVGPGGYTDLIARVTTKKLAEKFGVPFVVDNRGGGGGVLGTDYAIRSRPDGYTLWFGGGAQFSSAPLIKKLPYDPISGLTPISIVATNGLGLAVSPTLPVNNVADLLAYVKARPGKINYGVSGVGQSSHLAAALWASEEKLNMVMVPYSSVPNTMLSLLSGEIQVYFGNMIDLVKQAKTKQIKLLAVTSRTRLPQFPNTPTISESLPNYRFTSWVGYFAPSGTPAPIIEKLSTALADMCREKDVIDLFRNLGVECIGSTPEQGATEIQTDLPLAKAAVAAAGLSLQ